MRGQELAEGCDGQKVVRKSQRLEDVDTPEDETGTKYH